MYLLIDGLEVDLEKFLQWKNNKSDSFKKTPNNGSFLDIIISLRTVLLHNHLTL